MPEKSPGVLRRSARSRIRFALKRSQASRRYSQEHRQDSGMHSTKRQRRNPGHSGERIPLHARLHLTTVDGKPVAPLGRCTNISLGGLRVTAAEGLPPRNRRPDRASAPLRSPFSESWTRRVADDDASPFSSQYAHGERRRRQIRDRVRRRFYADLIADCSPTCCA